MMLKFLPCLLSVFTVVCMLLLMGNQNLLLFPRIGIVFLCLSCASVYLLQGLAMDRRKAESTICLMCGFIWIVSTVLQSLSLWNILLRP